MSQANATKIAGPVGNRSTAKLEIMCAEKPAYRPYGYTAAPSEGGRCAECGCTTGGHERDCEVVS